MLPVLHIFGLKLYTYYVCAALAGIVGFVLSFLALRRQKLGIMSIFLPLMIVVLAVVGARILNYLTNPDAYKKGFTLWTLRYTKLSLMGGLIVGITVILLYCIITRRSPGQIMDAFVIPAGVGIMILKLGCFCNGCCFGKPTDGIFGMEFPANRIRYRFIESLPLIRAKSPIVHPTQLYEIAGTIVALILAVLLGRYLGTGGRTALFGGLFALARWLVLPLRELPYSHKVIHTVYPTIYGASIALSVVLIVFMLRRNKVDNMASKVTEEST